MTGVQTCALPIFAVEFIGANAEELTAEAIKGYLNPRPVTEELNLNETMDEEELASFIAADPVQGVVDLPPPRPPLLLAEIEQHKATVAAQPLTTATMAQRHQKCGARSAACSGVPPRDFSPSDAPPLPTHSQKPTHVLPAKSASQAL